MFLSPNVAYAFSLWGGDTVQWLRARTTWCEATLPGVNLSCALYYLRNLEQENSFCAYMAGICIFFFSHWPTAGATLTQDVCAVIGVICALLLNTTISSHFWSPGEVGRNIFEFRRLALLLLTSSSPGTFFAS